ncbi:MAG: family phosphoesterase [Sphingomonas bacterium]|uniref:phosphoesterase n=1 Tax=Sphingomonas bacterium TaxID=1895847 RepID=UPI00260D4F89|nr:phosphoesterase [Sphingomonas bacterium]MDB5696870.1 family phosphoesterase [Sphingomonas bacterium]
MIGALSLDTDPRHAAREAFAAALAGIDRGRPITVLGHFDADGMSAIAILVRALRGAGWQVEPRVTGKGESPWDEGFAGTLGSPGGLIVADLGTRPEPVLPGTPTVVIDHHLPTGLPVGATTISGNGLSPEPTTALLAWWAAAALGDQADLQWLAALGLMGDMADEAAFPELTEARARWGKTALRDATSLVNAPRRTAACDAGPALRLLLTAHGPKAITKEPSADRDALLAAKAEVREAIESARRVAPKVRGEVALIRFHAAQQIHPLIAQQWRGRLKDKIVLAANTGYRDGWIHFAARSARGENLVDYLARHRPPGADGRYGNGHAQATGGALRPADWNAFVAGIGFPDEQVPA